MAYWWVNHKKTHDTEVSGDFLWSPKRNANDTFNKSYENMTEARPGDIVFSYAWGRISHVGVVQETANAATQPNFGISTNWGDDGWLLRVFFSPTQRTILPKDHLEAIRPLLGYKYAPILPNGNGKQVIYLGSIPEAMAKILLAAGGVDEQLLLAIGRPDSVLEDLDRVDTDPMVAETEKSQLRRARVGQGIFRSRVLLREPECRVTGITVESLLRASHIKPWRHSTNSERLNGANGLMLAPHVDLLFDKHLISFSDEGALLVSGALDPNVIEKWHIRRPEKLRAFAQDQKVFIGLHRQLLIDPKEVA